MGRACFHRIWRVGWLAALAGILAVLSAAPAAAEKRIALVIGNSAYKNVTPLDNPTRDAQLMAETLSSIGFTLVGGRALLDLDKSAMDSAVQEFGRQVVGADVALFEQYRTTSRSGGGGSFDGAWVVVSVGCGGSTRGAVVVSSGRIIGEGIVSGRVNPNGAASAVGNANGVRIVSSGQLSGRSGAGSFRRADGCSGRWTASKQ